MQDLHKRTKGNRSGASLQRYPHDHDTRKIGGGRSSKRRSLLWATRLRDARPILFFAVLREPLVFVALSERLNGLSAPCGVSEYMRRVSAHATVLGFIRCHFHGPYLR